MSHYLIDLDAKGIKASLQEVYKEQGYWAAVDFFLAWEQGLPKTAGPNSENVVLWDLADTLRRWLKEKRNESICFDMSHTE